MKLYSFCYSLKVWLSTVLVAPIIYIIADCFINHSNIDSHSTIELYPMMVFMEFLFSFVTWLLFWGITVLTGIFQLTGSLRKSLICTSGIILTICTFALFSLINSFSIHDMFFNLMLINSTFIGAGSWFYKLESAVSSAQPRFDNS